ncbi:TonB-dependent receptor plug domain-containing protein [Pseudokordiimonas caeni]|uniref:TonB-dependent receptor plug domain-containing protein n=1 Tax=Pseudokordiimonas caeni TaxID=2997908 RepID=UPI002810F00B|nr:TonB-dependent receptor [Pseudokordiimonas caeni]
MTKLTFFLLLSTLLTPAAIAAGEVETIEVTAVRAGDLSRAGVSLSVIDGTALENRQVYRLADVLAEVPGMAAATAGSVGGQTQLRLRGAEANQVLVLVDGVELNDPAAGDEVQFEHLTGLDIERIEVARAPLSAVWGSDAVAGVINIITKRAEEGVQGHVGGEYGAFDTKRLYGAVGAGSETFTSRLAVGYGKSDGTNVSRTGDEDDGYENLTVSGAIGVTPSEDFRLDLTLRHTDAESEFDGTDFATGLPADSDNRTENHSTTLGAAARISLLDGRWQQGLRVTFLDTSIDNYVGEAADGATSAQRLGLYADAAFTLSEGHTLTFAVDHENTDFTQEGIAQPWGDPNQKRSMDVTGFVAAYQGDVLEGLTLNASVRHDDNSDFRNFTSWRFALSQDLMDGRGKVYASAARAQKAPTFVERFGFYSDQFVGNPDLTPERSVSVEVGGSFDLVPEKLTLGAAVYRTRLKDEINGFVFDPASGLYTAGNVDGKSKRDGFELTADARPVDGFSLSASYAFVNAKEPDGAGGYQRELRRPKHSGSIVATWEATSALTLTASAAYTGEALDTFFPPWPLASETLTLKSYVLARVTGAYRINDHVSVTARVENVFDEKYENIVGFATPGAAAYAGLRIAL